AAAHRSRTEDHGRGLWADPRRAAPARLGAAAPAGPGVALARPQDRTESSVRLRMTRTVHIVGAGVAGLAAAGRLARRGARVVLHESAGHAGGRCRSYHDAQLDMTIDNGNHLLLSGNHATLAYLEAIGAAYRLPPPPAAAFPFIDLKTRERWTL